MCGFFSSNVSKKSFYLAIWHGVSLVKIAQRRRKLSVRTSELRNYDLGKLGIGRFYLYRVL